MASLEKKGTEELIKFDKQLWQAQSGSILSESLKHKELLQTLCQVLEVSKVELLLPAVKKISQVIQHVPKLEEVWRFITMVLTVCIVCSKYR